MTDRYRADSNLAEGFIQVVDKIQGRRQGSDVLEIASEWMRNVTRDDIIAHIKVIIEKDPSILYSSIISSPPDILPLAVRNGYAFEAICWRDNANESLRAENEDIHDHYCYIVSKALVGSPYRELVYEFSQNNEFVIVSDIQFNEGDINIIAPETIHKVILFGRSPAISIRFLFPGIKETSIVFSESGRHIKTLNNGIERKMLELSRMLDLLGGVDLCKHADNLRNGVLNLALFDSELTQKNSA